MKSNFVNEDPSVTRKRYINYYNAILSASDSQMLSIQGYGLTPYHKEIANVSYKWRKQAVMALKNRLRSLRR